MDEASRFLRQPHAPLHSRWGHPGPAPPREGALRPCLRGDGCSDGKAGAEEDVSNSSSESQSRLRAPCSWAEPRDERGRVHLSLFEALSLSPRVGFNRIHFSEGIPALRGLQTWENEGAVQRPHATQWVQEPDKAGVTVVAKRDVTWVQSRRCVSKSDPWEGFWGRMREKAIWAKKQVAPPCQHEKKVKVLVAQSRPTLCGPVDCSPPGSSVQGILQARMLE